MNHWEIYLEDLAIDLAWLIHPELQQSRAKAIYVENANACDLEFYVAADGGVLGATSGSMATWLRPYIGNRWRGNGPAMIINTDLCEVLAGIYEPARFSIANEVACHELTHIVLRPSLFRKGKSPCARQQFDRAVFTSVVESPATEDQRNHHGPGFVRLLLHIAERMRRFGRTVNHDHLLDWDACCPARPIQCEGALSDEINGLILRPLSEVALLAAPVQYTDLWNDPNLSERNSGV